MPLDDFGSAQLTAIALPLVADGWRNRCDGLVPPLYPVAQQLDLVGAARETPSRMISGTLMRSLSVLNSGALDTAGLSCDRASALSTRNPRALDAAGLTAGLTTDLAGRRQL